MSAKVWLVGAGPGDPELLTLKAVRALNAAQIVMIDDLVNPAVLEHCPGAKVISVGKRGGCRSTRLTPPRRARAAAQAPKTAAATPAPVFL